MSTLNVGGFVPCSTVDCPGALSAVVFCQGCPWRCAYCQNPHFQPCGPGSQSWASIRSWLESRRGLLDAVTFSGGEPTIQAGLPDAMADVRAMGFLVGLHTAGSCREGLARVLTLTDWVEFDVKSSRAGHSRVTTVLGSGEVAWQSLDALRGSGVPFGVHAIDDPDVLSEHDLASLDRELAEVGVLEWRLVARASNAESRATSSCTQVEVGEVTGRQRSESQS
jgi:pyruvate formate lyase activating enzyme